MVTRQRRHRVGAALATIPLSLGFLVLGGTDAQATPNGLYDCQTVIYIDLVPNKPASGFTCVGPLGNQPPGSIFEIPTGKRYSCYTLNGSIWVDGTIHVSGNNCTPF